MSFNIPECVFSLLNDEIKRIKKELIEEIAEDYNLDEKELIDKYLSNNLKLISKKEEKIKILHKGNYNKHLKKDSKERCTSITKSGKRCLNRAKELDLCYKHLKIYNNNGYLPNGVVNEENIDNVKSDDEEHFQVNIKKIKNKDLYKEEKKKDRCLARVRNTGLGARCSNKKEKNSDLCKLHIKKKEECGELKYGLIIEIKPKELFLRGDVKKEHLY
jgi:hypothetical protein